MKNIIIFLLGGFIATCDAQIINISGRPDVIYDEKGYIIRILEKEFNNVKKFSELKTLLGDPDFIYSDDIAIRYYYEFAGDEFMKIRFPSGSAKIIDSVVFFVNKDTDDIRRWEWGFCVIEEKSRSSENEQGHP